MNNLFSLDPKQLEKMQIVDWAYTEELSAQSFDQYESWVNNGLAGPLGYLTDFRKEKRESLNNNYPNAKSALVFLFSYKDVKKSLELKSLKNKIASYVLGFEGFDYHYWIKDKLENIGKSLQKEILGLNFELSLDVHPVLERDLAYRSGLGWFGKNSMLISQKEGSYTIIGSLILNKRLDITNRSIEIDHCGNCTLCIDQCPTSAIIGNKVVDASKCISTYTIELFKEAQPPKGYPTKSSEIYGCDICQEVCPWNNRPLKNAKEVKVPEIFEFFNKDNKEIIQELEGMSNREFRRKFKMTPLERTGRLGLIKNLNKSN